MIVEVLRAARRLDEMLQQKLGRPYSVLIGIGLVIEIIARVGGPVATEPKVQFKPVGESSGEAP